MHVMPHLVRHHHLDLVVRVVGEERVGEKDAAGGAGADERRAGPAAALAERQLVDVQDRHAGARREALEPIAQHVPRERPRAVQERQQQHRPGRRQQADDDGASAGGSGPPGARPAHRPVDELGERNRDDQREQGGLELPTQPAGPGDVD